MAKKQELQDEWQMPLRKSVSLKDDKGNITETFDHLDLREPMVEEVEDFWKRATKEPLGAVRYLIARVSGAPLSVVAKMGARDFTAAQKYLTAFFTDDEDGDDADDSEGGEGK